MRIATLGLFVLTCACLVCACGGGKPADNKPKAAPAVTRKPVPQDFADKKSPTPLDDAAFIAKGKALYEDPGKGNCVMCHGESGKGNGPQAANYTNPNVANLTDAAFHGDVTDQYIFWRITDVQGSKSDLKSAMLGFPGGSDEERWAVVAYVRSLKGK